MAHPCCMCGSECYCHGDIDDVIVSHTPGNCETCGCETFWADDEEWDEDDYDWDEERDDDEELQPTKDGGLLDPQTGVIHYL